MKTDLLVVPLKISTPASVPLLPFAMQLCLQTAFFKSRLYGFGGRSWFHSQICHYCGKQSAHASQLKSCGLQGLGLRGPPLLLSNCNWKQLFQSTAWEIRNSCPQLPNPLGFYQASYNPLEIRNMKIMMKPNKGIFWFPSFVLPGSLPSL